MPIGPYYRDNDGGIVKAMTAYDIQMRAQNRTTFAVANPGKTWPGDLQGQPQYFAPHNPNVPYAPDKLSPPRVTIPQNPDGSTRAPTRLESVMLKLDRLIPRWGQGGNQ